MKRVLVLGAGMVSRPLVVWLLGKGYFLTVADMNKDKAVHVIGEHPAAHAITFDAKNEEELDALIEKHDLVVSLLPATMHLQVARFCIKRQKNLITTSYQSPGMLELKTAIDESGILVLNEMGLDPGIDHMSAKRVIDRVHAQQGQVTEFYSLCGALPAPEAADNPLAYKFSWSPYGVMAASMNGARYLVNGEEVTIAPELLFADPGKIDFPEVGVLEVYPNRDSVSYINDYGIDEVRTILRGTLRLPGWCETLHAMKTLGLLDNQPMNFEHMSYFNLIERKTGTLYPQYECQIAKFLSIEETSNAIRALKWLGFFSNDPIGHSVDTPFNITCDLMFKKMMLKETERDMIVMQHEFQVKYPGDREERITARLLEYGPPGGDSAIARTVALPAAIAADLILSGELTLTGLLRPFMPEIYEPVLRKLEEEGIVLKEEVRLLV